MFVWFDKCVKSFSVPKTMIGHFFQLHPMLQDHNLICGWFFIKVRHFPSNFWKHVISSLTNNGLSVRWFSYLFWRHSWNMILLGRGTITTLVKHKFHLKFDGFSQNCSRHFVYFHSRLARMLPYFVRSKRYNINFLHSIVKSIWLSSKYV